MAGYQHLEKYKGSLYGNLNYSGIEYDYEVPDNIVVASPGGVSGIHHHYPKGVYSDDASSTDIHAGEGDAYVYGEYGNVYQQGQSATRLMGDFVEPPDLNGQHNYTANQSQIRRENFRPVNDHSGSTPGMEFIPSPDDSTVTRIATTPVPDPVTPAKSISVESILKLMVVFTSGYMAMNFWVKGGEELITKKFYGDKDMEWKDYVILAGLFTMVVLLFTYAFGVPLVTLEKI